MKNYKIEVSKDNKRYTMLLKAEDELSARDRVHRDWYSILAIKEVSGNEDIGNTFIFEWHNSNWELKHWKIAWNDIFKAYVKLTRDLWYDLDYIYHEKENWISLEKRQEIIDELKEEYDLLFNTKKNKRDETRLKKVNSKNNMDLSEFYLKKELEETNILIDRVLDKINDIFELRILKTITDRRKEKLKLIYNEIIKLQKSSNISKLKEIWELALTKIWELELEELEKTKNQEDRKTLKETNKLLRELWSRNQFIEKDRDVFYQFKSIINTLREIFEKENSNTSKNFTEELDKDSHIYAKNNLYLNKYKQRSVENKKIILKNLFKFLFNKEFREDILLEQNVINQNVVLLKARQKWIWISYTLMKRWFWKLMDNILWFFKSLEPILFYVIISYTWIFILYYNIYLYYPIIDFSFNWIFLLIILIIFYLGVHISKSIFSLIISFVILFIIVIFGVINF